MAFFVFFPGATGTRIIAADFSAGANGLGRFRLRGSCLVLQFFLLALLLALHFAGESRQTRGRNWFFRARGGTGHGSLRILL